MPNNQPEKIPLTWEQVTPFRLARQHLLERAARHQLVSVAGDMNGAQAQLLPAAQISLWARLRDLQVADVAAALHEKSLVKAACMRNTLFLVPVERLAVFARGAARRGEKEIHWARGKGVPERVIEAAIQAALEALDEPRTRPEIAERASRSLGVQVQEIQGGGWGSRSKVAAVPVGDLTYPVVDLLHLAGARGVICYGPYRQNEPTFVRAEAWIPGWQDLPVEEAEGLLRYYLQAYAPASPADFALWSGLTLTEAGAIWRRQQAGLAMVDLQGRETTVLQEDLEVFTHTRFERPPVRLLPYFDTYLLGHRDREHLVAEPHRAKIYRPQGWIAPVVLVNGRAMAVWAHTRVEDRLDIQIKQFEPLSPHIRNEIQEEARELGRFLGVPQVEVRFD